MKLIIAKYFQNPESLLDEAQKGCKYLFQHAYDEVCGQDKAILFDGLNNGNKTSKNPLLLSTVKCRILQMELMVQIQL